MALIRPALLAALVYLGYSVAFPDDSGTIHHVIAIALFIGFTMPQKSGKIVGLFPKR